MNFDRTSVKFLNNGSSAHPAYTEFVVVRHGETEWNADRRIQGHVDIDLNEVGRQQQAALVADRLSKEPKISAVYSSDLTRHKQLLIDVVVLRVVARVLINYMSVPHVLFKELQQSIEVSEWSW
ncbi:unnamed protein product [Linum tenue]|uniref:Phosphoglycerate mutase n=1 Tax=Linum tenue TaxID=586396 RepID=A0AAV0L547_9ROSI|nr:unnamed protein product [Linum tenue]